jgi:hypothetical protein
MKVRPFIVVVVDAEGATHDYVFKARSGRQAKRDAREWVERSAWATALLSVTAMVDRTRARRRRLLAFGTLTFVVAGTTITSMMFIGLSLQGLI